MILQKHVKLNRLQPFLSMLLNRFFLSNRKNFPDSIEKLWKCILIHYQDEVPQTIVIVDSAEIATEDETPEATEDYPDAAAAAAECKEAAAAAAADEPRAVAADEAADPEAADAAAAELFPSPSLSSLLS